MRFDPGHYDFGDIGGLLLIGVATLSLLVMALWPKLVGDRRARRIGRIRVERAAIRVQERERLRAARPPSLRDSPRRVFSQVVSRLQGEDAARRRQRLADTARVLRRAGFRGEAPAMTYLALRILLPIAGASLAALGLWMFGDGPQTPLTQAAMLLAGAGAGYVAPPVYVQNTIVRRRTALLRSWPDALDLLLICVESGMTAEVALARVADEIAEPAPELAEELNFTVAELAYLQDRSQALRNFGERSGLHSVRAVVSSLMQSEKYGTGLAHSLRVIAQEQRDARLIEAEKKAAALPPKLTVPMIVFFLPALFIVILLPAVIQLLDAY